MADTEDNPLATLDKRLQELEKRFAQQLPGRMATLQQLFEDLTQHGYQPEKATAFCRELHNLAGSAGTFKAVNVSRHAKALEKVCSSEAELFGVQVQEQFAKLLQAAANWQQDSGAYVPQDLPSEQAYQFNPLVYLVEDDQDLADFVSGLLSRVGYELRHFHSLAEFSEYTMASSQQPGVIIMDIVFEEGEVAGAELILQMRRRNPFMPPVIFISMRDDIAARLAAVRAGARRYLAKPLDFNNLLQTVDGISGRQLKEAFRVLLVDDEPEMLQYHAALLQQKGVQVKTMQDPMAVWDELSLFDPELIVLDVYMPVCSGLELAAVIRQDNRWANIPIIFLSSESDLDRQLTAMDLGGDDFISKPVDAASFADSIIPRLKRTRWVKRLNSDLQSALRRSEYQRLALDRHSIVSITNAQGQITEVNEKFCEISQYTSNELVGQTHRLINSGTHPSSFFSEMWQTISSGRVWHGLICNRKKNGELYWVDSTIVPFLDESDLPYQYVSIRTDVTRIKQSEEQQEVSKQAAEKANEAKSRFLSLMSHELRTPLNAVLGYAQLLRGVSEKELNPRQENYVGEIEKAGWHLLNLIDEVLELPLIESGKIKLSIEPVVLGEVISECQSLIKPSILEHGLGFSLDVNQCLNMEVYADYTRLKQILINLLSNAIKYNEKGGDVSMSCALLDDSFVRVSIEDTGIGIDPVYFDEMFTLFSRLGAENSGVQGTGLGLAVCKQIIELMGGRIGFSSELGKGSCFWIDIATRAPAPVVNATDTAEASDHSF